MSSSHLSHVRNWHTWPRFSVTEAVLMLREHHHPTMLNMPDALVWARLELNMQGSKKEKFIDAYSVMTPVAHPFERGVAEKSVLVFVQNTDAAKAAEAAGDRYTWHRKIVEYMRIFRGYKSWRAGAGGGYC